MPRYVATVRGVGYRAAGRVEGGGRGGVDERPMRPDGIATRIVLASLLVAGIALALVAVGVCGSGPGRSQT